MNVNIQTLGEVELSPVSNFLPFISSVSKQVPTPIEVGLKLTLDPNKGEQ